MLSNEILISDFRGDEAAMLPGSAESFVNRHVLSLKDYAGLADRSQRSSSESSPKEIIALLRVIQAPPVNP